MAGLAIPLQVTVYDHTEFAGNSGTLTGGEFSLAVSLGGSDITDTLVGEIQVSAEEGSARVANFSIVTPSGIFEPDAWLNQPVYIDFIKGGGSFRLFTGIVDLPELSKDGQTLTLACTDNRQGWFEGKTRDTIERIFLGSGALWHASVFGDYETAANFAVDLEGTISASVDLDRNGQMVFTPWHSSSFDFTFSDAEIIPESVSVEWGGRREMVNSIRLEINYTHQLLRQRDHEYQWDYPRTFEDYLQLNTTLPNSDAISQAATGGGWRLADPIVFGRLPPSGVIDLPGGSTNWIISEENRAFLAISADFTLSRRWAQEVRETHFVTLQCSGNIAHFGLLEDELAVSLEESIDTGLFENGDYTPPDPGIVIGSDITWSTRDEADLQAVVDTAMAQATATILGSHRLSGASFTTLLQPEIECSHYATLSGGSVQAAGKVRSVSHTLSLDAGSALTTVEIAVFRGVEAVAGALQIVPPVISEPVEPSITVLGTEIQLLDGSLEAPPEDFAGYVGNELPISNDTPFEERFTVVTPEISELSRDPYEFEDFTVVESVMYNQTLVVNL